MSGKRVNWIDVIEGRVKGDIFDSPITPKFNSIAFKKPNNCPKNAPHESEDERREED